MTPACRACSPTSILTMGLALSSPEATSGFPSCHHFRWLPALATKALHNLAREDLTPMTALDKSTDTEVAAQVYQLHMQPSNPDMLKQAVHKVLVEGGHQLLSPDVEDYLSDQGSEIDCINTPPMSPLRRVILDSA